MTLNFTGEGHRGFMLPNNPSSFTVSEAVSRNSAGGLPAVSPTRLTAHGKPSALSCCSSSIRLLGIINGVADCDMGIVGGLATGHALPNGQILPAARLERRPRQPTKSQSFAAHCACAQSLSAQP